jgi:hypothetical protein
VTMPIAKDSFLARLNRQAFEAGKARGEARGEAIGMSKVLRGLLETKFGPLPKWAQARMANANRARLERWARKVLVADRLEAVIGPRQRNGA